MLSAEMLLADRGRDGFYAASGSAGRERLLRIPERHMICDIEPTSTGLLDLTTEIVAAYAKHNVLDPMDLSKLIADTHAALGDLGESAVLEPVPGLTPAIPI